MAAAEKHSTPGPPVVVTLGNPNTGKSSLFNVLTGLNQKVGNFPGVTVDYLAGQFELAGQSVRLIDVPGTYSLAAQSPDEIITLDVLLGNVADIPSPNAAILVLDSTNLRRNLFLASQIRELSMPFVVALTMSDMAQERGINIDIDALSEALKAPVVPIVASTGEGVSDLKEALNEALNLPPPEPIILNEDHHRAAAELAKEISQQAAHHPFEIYRTLIDKGGYLEKRLIAQHPTLASKLEDLRGKLSHGRDLTTLEARDRYSWINSIVTKVETRPVTKTFKGEIADRIVNHPVYGSLLFVIVMAIIFQSVFAWANPLMDMIDGASAALGGWVYAKLGDTLLASFIADGVIAGVGSVIIFLPQIIFLFTFIIILEDSGYMARAAFLMDRLMRWCGLSGQSFIPMLSSFACAVPGIMGTRVIPNYRDRIATIIAAPFMTCSARLPVYALLIAAFVPADRILGGWINIQGLVLLGFYFLGIFAAIFTAFLLHVTLLKKQTANFLLELPPYRMPNLRAVLIKLLGRAGIFLKRAGTIIFTVAVIVWALASFPQAKDGTPASIAIEQSYLGKASRTVAPLFEPLGWDWKVTAAVIASFPAREVVIAVLGTLYAIDDPETQQDSLIERIRQSKRPNGEPVFTVPMAFGVMVFFALCLQCVSTIAIMRRETNSWRWPIFSWVYMTSLGYVGAFLCYQIGSRL
ncbi:MAG: ferrous iron transport protein B [Gammaproteobacteria bacterium]